MINSVDGQSSEETFTDQFSTINDFTNKQMKDPNQHVDEKGSDCEDTSDQVEQPDQQAKNSSQINGAKQDIITLPSDDVVPSAEGNLQISSAQSGDSLQADWRKKWGLCCIKIVLGIAGLLFVFALFALYVVIPCLFYWSTKFRRKMVFRTFSGASTGSFSDPESLGINCSQNFYVSSDQGIRLGTWYVQSHALPCSLNRTVFLGTPMTALYIHGVSGDRKSAARVNTLKVLSASAKLHVVTFDFRGFGDSTDVTPSLEGVVRDTLAVYKSIRAIIPSQKIIVWGHSLGSSIALYLLAQLKKMNDSPFAVVLESAFDNLGTVSKVTPYSKLWQWMPCFNALVPDSIMSDPATMFDSVKQANKLQPSLPILMLHSEDDNVVPVGHGKLLHSALVSARKDDPASGPVIFISFKASHNYGHNNIATYPGLKGIIERFLNFSKSMPIMSPPLR
ncbi:monoacylglycerol lipase ABHD12-like [Varroa jacobsoni]|uniref:monoacylglycerol lipase ABHD12-like n=1 Tax=Varroa jacobsoni TaxID=62625 RepID=UPI000BF5FE37|nr:monoacylglycerol lipase ABHD12-like [Varroa jacobsoni]